MNATSFITIIATTTRAFLVLPVSGNAKPLNIAQLALVTSGISALIAGISLGWNIYRIFLFVRR